MQKKYAHFRLDSDLAKRNSFAHFSAFRPVAKIGDILQLNTSPSTQDSGEICEVSTTVDKDEENEPPSMYFFYTLWEKSRLKSRLFSHVM